RDRNVTGVQTCALPILFAALLQPVLYLSLPCLVGAQAAHPPAHVGLEAHLIDLDAGAAAGDLDAVAEFGADGAQGLVAVVAIAQDRKSVVANLDGQIRGQIGRASWRGSVEDTERG